jgi:hypothetical protein
MGNFNPLSGPNKMLAPVDPRAKTGDDLPMFRYARLPALMVALGLGGCEITRRPKQIPADGGQVHAQSPTSSLRPIFDPGSASFFGTPWPSDHRRRTGGELALEQFPRSDLPLIKSFTETLGAAVNGFSTMPVITIAFEQNPGDVVLPAAPETLDESGSVQLIKLDESCDRRVPLEVVFRSQDDPFLPKHHLAAAPVPGFVLEPRTTYGLIVTRSFGGAKGETRTLRPPLLDACLVGPPFGAHDRVRASFAPLRRCIDSGRLIEKEIAVATVFTTQDPLTELRALHQAVTDPLRTARPQLRNWQKESTKTYTNVPNAYQSYVAVYDTPIYQSGASPYITGGGFQFNGAGDPIVARWEAVPMIVSIPLGTGPHAVFIWQSGARASLTGHVDQPFITTLLRRGIAVAKFLPQFHGARNVQGGDPDLHTYNYLNPESARAVLRQQVLDSAYFVRVVREALPLAPEASRLAPARLVMGGHSQGAEVCAMLGATSSEISAYLLSGVGTYVSETIVHRTDPFDVQALLTSLLDLAGPVDRFHPLIQLIQLGADVVDPNNHLQSWHGWSGNTAGVHVLVVDGKEDQDVYFTSMNAMVIGGDLAPLEPAGWDVDPFGVWDKMAEPLPLAGNRVSRAGTRLTMAALLDGKDDHYILWNSEPARTTAVNFVESAFSGIPIVR